MESEGQPVHLPDDAGHLPLRTDGKREAKLAKTVPTSDNRP